MRRSRLTAGLLLCLFATGYAQGNPDHSIEAIRFEELPETGISLDGHLEPLWLNSTPVTGFVQMRPDEGMVSSQETYVYVMYSAEALYVAFDNRDSAPDSISGRVQRRDRGGNSDIVFLYLDPFHDLRTGYFFGVTAGGVQLDGTVADEDRYDDTWDGIWESAVAQNEHGWVAELRIPFSSFRHSGDRPDGWGVNFERDILRRNEETYWRPQARQSGNKVSTWGVLRGLDSIDPGAHIEVLPHAIARWDSPEGSVEWDGINTFREARENVGLDLKIVPSPSYTVDLTINPDFAQVDVDDEVINLSDYPVYLSEKRPFFLEGLDLFQATGYQLLYTRKITNPEFGARLTGKWGDFRGSALAAQNVAYNGSRQAIGAIRSTMNVGEINTVGLTATSLVDQDSNFHAFTSGIDSRLRWGEDNTFEWILAGVDRTGSSQQPLGSAFHVFLDNNEGWRGETSGEYKGRDFNVNDLGFTGYSNVMSQYFWLQRYHYPETGRFESLSFNINLYHEMMPDLDLYEKMFNWNAHAATVENFEFGGGMAWGAGHFREREPRDSLVVAQSKYQDNFGQFYPEFHPWYNRWFYIHTDNRKPVDFFAEFNHGTHREGMRVSTYGEVEWRALPNLELGLESNWVQVDNAWSENDGALTNHLVNRLKVQYSPTLDLSFRATFQHVSTNYKSVNNGRLLSNILLAWNYSPGSWAYLVYDDSRPTDAELAYIRSDRTLRLKWTWFTAI
jgi:hypothetical protein